MSKRQDSKVGVLILGLFYGALLGIILERKRRELEHDQNEQWEAIWDMRTHIRKLRLETGLDPKPEYPEAEPIPVRIVVGNTGE